MTSIVFFIIPRSITFIKNKLDPDDLGIILLNNFLDEFFPNCEPHFPPKAFLIYHYNGLLQSSNSRKVCYKIIPYMEVVIFGGVNRNYLLKN